MSKPPPLVCHWNGDAFIPWSVPTARRHFKAGSNYSLVVHEERSMASHNAYFAALDDRWQTLPEGLTMEYPSRESLRHKALIACGYCSERDFVLPTPRAATQFAAVLIEADDEQYTIVELRGRIVRRYRAVSQAYRAMGKAAFEKSKADVLDWIDRHLLGIDNASQGQGELVRRAE